jgi:hypothetical protein
VIEINEYTQLYTKHRLHLSNLGKEILSFNLLLEIFSLIEKKNSPNTNITELRNHEAQPPTVSPSLNQLIPLTSVENAENTLDKCIRKKPAIRMISYVKCGNVNSNAKVITQLI